MEPLALGRLPSDGCTRSSLLRVSPSRRAGSRGVLGIPNQPLLPDSFFLHERHGVFLLPHTLLLPLPKLPWISLCWIPSSPSPICRGSCGARVAPLSSPTAIDLASRHRRKPHTPKLDGLASRLVEILAITLDLPAWWEDGGDSGQIVPANRPRVTYSAPWMHQS